MIKTIQIGDKEVALDNNIVWALHYRSQFGKDIIPTLMPLLAAVLDVVSGVVRSGEDVDGNIDVNKVLKTVDGDYVTDAIVHLSGLELNDFIEITWALAKTADETIPEPEKWLRQFDTFPLDVIGPEVFTMIAKGVMSSKNWTRLEGQLKNLQPKSSSTTSSSQRQSAD